VTTSIDLPDGLAARSLTLDDAPAVVEVIGAEELVDLGQAEVTVDEIVGDWQQPRFDLATTTVGVFEGDRLLGYGDVSDGDATYAAVLPDHQRRGIGTAIARWAQATARANGVATISSNVPEGSAADRLLSALGYRVRWTAWDLELPAGGEIQARPLPDGFALRDAAEADREAAWTLLEDAFLEWSDRERQTLDELGRRIWGRPNYEPWNLRLLSNADGELVGAVHVHLADEAGYVAKIAVRRDHRGRGLAAPMLLDAFRLAREHGAVRCYLSTDTRAGARTLYEKVGMVVASTWVNRAIDL
jgi:GNAT superfamily N-acetyltransferase